MLCSLKIINYALIEKLEITFDSGFSTVTGETGAGKSVIMGALHLLLGQRAETSVLKNPEQKSIIEAQWQINEYNLKSFFDENDVEYDDISIIRREIHPNGKSRAFVNDMPVNLQFLKELGDKLIDIHSQHQNLLLNSEMFQLSVIDAAADNKAIIQSYNELYIKYKNVQKDLKSIKQKAEKSKETYDFNLFVFNELKNAKLKAGEQEELEVQLKQLEHAEEIQSTFSNIQFFLKTDETNILSHLKTFIKDISKLNQVYEKADTLSVRMESTYYELEDIANEIEQITENVILDPEQLKNTQERLNLIYTLEQKHKVTNIGELIDIQNRLDKELQETDSYTEQIVNLEKQLLDVQNKLQIQADELTNSRKLVFEQIENSISSQLKELGMPNANFKIDHKKLTDFHDTGCDSISFLFAANKNSRFEIISSVASGGEISRVMLCLKQIISQSKALPTIIFDEIDTGVSGDIAAKMGEIMIAMAQNMQVLSITHLPQIAVKGNNQYLVYKFDTDHTTNTAIKKLTEQERVEEIAKMLSGSITTDAAISNAKELLRNK